MGTCASNRRHMVVRQSSVLKFGGTTKNLVLPKKPLTSSQHPPVTTSINAKSDSLQNNNSAKVLRKKESDLNLLPPELQRNWTIISDESIFEREKRMVVLLVSAQQDKPSQVALVDVDFQSPGFGKVICRLSMPLPGEELYSFACMRNTHSMLHRDDGELYLNSKENDSYTLVVPAPAHSRVYLLSLQDCSQQQQQLQENPVLTQMRIQKCITREELSRWDLGAPLCVCSNNAGRSSAVPLFIVTAVDRSGHCKGDLLRLDRRTFCPVDRRRRSLTDDDRTSSVNSSGTSASGGSPLHSGATSVTVSGITPTIVPARFPHFGGAMAIHLRHHVVFTTEWGNLELLLNKQPDLRPPQLGSQDMLNSDCPQPEDPIYGNRINVWEMRRRVLLQTIKLEPPEDGRWPVCVRMVHHVELTHGFVCTALGSCIYHLHKSTKTGLYSADRVAKFSSVSVGDWPGEVPEVPAFLTDMAISMDDQQLYVCAAFHGFVAQMNISDPFRPTLTQKVFLGGIVYRCMGILHGGKTPKGKDSALRSYNTERRQFGGRPFEGGPSRLQLSLDGRRLFVSNAFLRNWDEHFFPQMAERGSMIVMCHIDPVGTSPMKLDPEFGIHFEEPDASEHHHQRHRATEQRNGGIATGPNVAPQSARYCYTREMRFLNGDSTADFV